MVIKVLSSRSQRMARDPAAGFAAGADDGCADSATDAGGFGVEGDGVELVLGASQDIEAATPPRVLDV
jgi:hypothetical protein